MRRSIAWFKIYQKGRNDPKIRSLSDAQFHVWFNLICYAAEQENDRGCIDDYDDDLLSIEVADGDVYLLDDTLQTLANLGIVSAVDRNICFLQFPKQKK